jgi:hypothetical protein
LNIIQNRCQQDYHAHNSTPELTNMRNLCSLAFLLLCSLSVQAMDMFRVDETLVLSGPVVREDAQNFEKMLDAAPIRTVLFRDSNGGDLKAGYAIGERIRRDQLNTAVIGHCASSCAVMFMGGVQRQMVGGKRLKDTRLGFHGPHKKASKQVDERGISRLYDWIMTASNGQFNQNLLHKALYITAPKDIMFFYFPDADSNHVWFCRQGVKPRPARCEAQQEANAITSAVLTSAELLEPAPWMTSGKLVTADQLGED